MADEVKARARKIAKFGRFAGEFLDVVLTEIAQAQGVGVANRGGGKEFGDGQQRDAGRIAVRARGCGVDARANRRQSLRQSLR
jgi:hypothetical protein